MRRDSGKGGRKWQENAVMTSVAKCDKLPFPTIKMKQGEWNMKRCSFVRPPGYSQTSNLSLQVNFLSTSIIVKAVSFERHQESYSSERVLLHNQTRKKMKYTKSPPSFSLLAVQHTKETLHCKRNPHLTRKCLFPGISQKSSLQKSISNRTLLQCHHCLLSEVIKILQSSTFSLKVDYLISAALIQSQDRHNEGVFAFEKVKLR